MDQIIEKFIPSVNYRNFLQNSGISLNAGQMAKLICRSNRPFEEKWEAYESLIRDESTGGDLLECLKQITAYEKVFVEKELSEKQDTVYVLETFDPEDPQGGEEVSIFNSLRVAERIGRKFGNGFRITRHSIKALLEEDIAAYEAVIAAGDYIDTSTQVFHYDGNGRLLALDEMSNVEPDRAEYEKYCNAIDCVDRFFADFPNCFKNGDIVQAVGNCRLKGLYGIIHVPPDHEKEIERIKAIPGMIPDDEWRVEFLYEDGNFGHHHLLVTELEKVETDKIPEKQRMVLGCASSLINGRGMIEESQRNVDEIGM